MKKLLTCFFVITMFAPSVYAADGAVSRVIPSGDATKTTVGRTSDTATHETTKSASRTAVSRVANRDVATEKSNSENSVRNTVSRVFSGAATKEVGLDKKTVSRGGVVSRSSVSDTKSNTRGGLDMAVNTVGRNERVSSASINSDPSVRRAGLVLRPSTAEVGGRATIGDTGVQTGSNIDEQLRSVKSRASNVQATAESIAEATERLESTATLNKSCQEQYNECMDQFCAIVDANQKRCSCSANIAKYAKVEEAVKDANVQLNDVAQRIRYVGLSADEIRAIMTETEAEEVLSGTKDTSETRDMLSQIEDLIRDPKSSASYSSGDTGFGLDIDLDFSSDSADMFSLDFLSGNNTGNLSNMRGTELYNAAKKRCNTVLDQCKQAGATVNQITGNYDLAIDKDCVAYEQGLTKMNETLLGNVRSANLMLQKARLAVLQNKNQYDAKGCIGALEACMTDDMVCGDKYYKCVDPTKRYIDEKGNVVLGQNISHITSFMKNYNNAAINTDFLTNAYGKTISVENCKTDPVDEHKGGTGDCVVKYLLSKIGTKQKVTDEGLCRAVLDKCQAYTYDSNGNYKPYNDVVTNYIQRALINIRAAQYNIISEYASSCMVDVANCYNQQVTQVNSWSASASLSNIYNVMKGACRNVALTCAYAVFNEHGDTSLCNTNEKCIESVSQMFYNSLLCEDGFVYRNGECVSENKCVISGGTWNEATGKCTCPSDAPYDSATGGCVVKDMCSRVNVGGYGTIYVKNNSTVHLTKDCSDTAITSIMPTKTNAEYEGSYNNTSFTGSQCVYKNGKIDLINCPVTKANVVWSTKFTCKVGFQDLNGVCVASGTTKQIPIVVSSDLSGWITAIAGVTFECSTAAETRISGYSTYATTDIDAPGYDAGLETSVRACYQSYIPPDGSAQHTCEKMPAKVCSDPNTKLYIVIDEVWATT